MSATTLESQLLARNGTQKGSEINFRCPNPNHADNNPSCFYNTETGLWHCFSCGSKGHKDDLIEILGVKVTSEPKTEKPKEKKKQKKIITPERIKEHLEASKKLPKVPSALLKHGFTREQCKELKISNDGTNAIIPIFDEIGEVKNFKVRYATGNQRYSYLYEGVGAPAWCSLDNQDKTTLLIIEGELNAMAVWLALDKSIAVMGVAGSNAKLNTAMLKNRSEILVYADNDEPGDKAKTLWGDIASQHCTNVKLLKALKDDACDINANLNMQVLKNEYQTLIAQAVKHIAQGNVFQEPEPDREAANVNIIIYQSGYAIEKERSSGKNETETYYEQLTNWIFKPENELHYPDNQKGERGQLIINGEQGIELTLPAKAWNSRRDLLDYIGGFGATCFTSQNSEIAKIRQFLVLNKGNLPIAKGVNSYGLHKVNDQWQAIYSNTATESLFYSGVKVDPSNAYHFAPKSKKDKLDESRQAILKITELGTTETVLAMLGYAIASAFSPKLTKYLNNRLPFLYVTAERETGKTTLAEAMLELVTGYSLSAHKAMGLSEYQYDVAFSNQNNLLGILDEYRSGGVKESQIRKHHDLGFKTRGRGNNNDETLHLNRPMIMLGEGFVEDSATLSRGVLYFLDKRDRGSFDKYTEFQNLSLSGYAKHLHEAALKIDKKGIEALADTAKTLAAKVNTKSPREVYALSYLAFGLLYLRLDFKHAGFNADIFSNENISKVLNKPYQDEVSDFGSSGGESLTNLESFLEQLGYALSSVKDIESFISISAASAPNALDHDLLIKKSAAVKLVKDKFKSESAIMNARMLTRLSTDNDFCRSSDVHKTVQNFPFRGLRVDLDKVPSSCDAEQLKYFVSFLVNKYEPNG